MIYLGPDQILASDVDTTWEPNGRVRIKYDRENFNSREFISVPGLLMRTAKKYPDHVALVSRVGVDGKRRTYTYRYDNNKKLLYSLFVGLKIIISNERLFFS